MNDTSPKIEALYHAMLMARSGAERLLMACAMFDDARSIVEDSIRTAHPDIDEGALRQAVFLHFYGHEFTPDERARIMTGIAGAWRRSREQGLV